MQGAEEKPRPSRPNICDGTDAARGVLAFIVFISHFAQIFFGDAYALGLAPSLSVLFFFAISGFVSAPVYFDIWRKMGLLTWPRSRRGDSFELCRR